MKPHVLIIKLSYRAWTACAVIDTDIGHSVRKVINRLIFFAPKKLFEYQRRIGKRVLEKERCVNKIICCDRGLIERKKNAK